MARRFRPLKFASRTDLAIEQLLDGEPLERILPNLSGRETKEYILHLLREKLEKKESKE